MAKLRINKTTGQFDLIGMTAAEVAAYVKISGDTMTGDLTAPAFHATDSGESTFNDPVRFNSGIIIKAGQRIVLDGK